MYFAREVLLWLENNIWVPVIVTVIIAVAYILTDIFNRRSQSYIMRGEIFDQVQYFRAQRKKDIVCMCLYAVFVIPASIILTLSLLKVEMPQLENSLFYIEIYCFVIGIVLMVIRRDKILLWLWFLPTVMLFTSSDSNNSLAGLLLLFVGLPLFVLKISVMLLYVFLVVAANSIISVAYVFVVYPIYIVQGTKAINNYDF